jgi:diguanylate cyclase (GGDEF)-like protein/PAS domain S-box-containing protein
MAIDGALPPDRETTYGSVSDGSIPDHADDSEAQSVMVVDDDARLRELLCTVLAPLGCEIIGAASGEEALTELLTRRVSVIVLDINMPGMDGFETAQLVRETDELASTPIIFLTGQSADDCDLQRGYELGAVDFLVKPVARQVLFAKVKALLELDQSFARLRSEAARFHEQQLLAARAAEVRQREELAFTRRRERLTNIFAEASIDLTTLERAIVTELSHLFNADCVLRLSSPGRGWHDSLSHSGTGNTPTQLESWLVERLADRGAESTPYREVMVQELTARSQRVGVVCVGRADGPPFSDSDAALFRGACTAAALAVSNATLYRIQAEYAAVMQATGDAILAVDASGEIRSCNKAATALFGGDYDTLLGRNIMEFAADSHRERLREQLDYTLAAHKEVSMEVTCATTDGRHIEVVITLSPIGDSIELHVAAVVHDLTQIKRAQEEIRHLASHDPLTDLANRRQLNERLAAAAHRYAVTQDSVALLYMDFNQFKLVNDTYGHDTGDDLLQEVASRLRAAVSPDTLVCRVGGDEFIVLIEADLSVEAAQAAGNRILKQIQSAPVQCRNATITPSLSMGISYLGPSGAHTAEELLSQADLAMFEAKKNHLEECVVYTELIGSRHKESAYLRSEMSDAIERSEFRMVYQPIINARTGGIFGVEALLRWRVGDEEIPAGEIIALAEAAKQTNPLGRWILQRSFEDYAAFGMPDLQMHINLSPDQLLDPTFVDELVRAYQSTGVNPANICLELTERAFSREPMPAYVALQRAREMGFSLAIDDFGVEYASMTNLMHVPVDWLKIDRSFISEVHHNERVQRLVRGQIAVASAMQVNLIAEGVENEEQAHWLLDAGCWLHQGYLYAKPTETADLAELIKKQAPDWRARAGSERAT